MRRELDRIRRLSKMERDPEVRRSLEEVLEAGEKLLDAYSSSDPPEDPLEVILLGAIVELFSRCREAVAERR